MSESQDKQVQLLIENVRISLAYLFRPYVGKSDDGKEQKSYKTDCIITPTHPALQKIKDAQRRVAQAGWPGSWEQVMQQLAAQDKLCLHKGDIGRADREEYKGNYYITANVKVKPRIVVTRNGANVEIAEDDPCAPYSGCWANVLVAIWPQSPDGGKPSKWGKRINAQLMGVQFLRHDEKFGGGGRIAKVDEFGIVAPDADGAVPMAAAQTSGPGADLI
jgi:hypothetical protein